jgi:hypothetical protein
MQYLSYKSYLIQLTLDAIQKYISEKKNAKQIRFIYKGGRSQLKDNTKGQRWTKKKTTGMLNNDVMYIGHNTYE